MSDWKKVFSIIWTGQLFSTLSSMVVGYSVIFWLSISSGSAEVLAYATIAAILPNLILGLFTGVYIDRWNRKRIMIISDMFIALCTLAIAIMFYQGNVSHMLIYVLLALRSAATAFHTPAMQASVPLLAPEDKLMRIAGVNNVIQSVSTIVSPALAALLITILELKWVLLFDVAGAIIACISLTMVHIPDPRREETGMRPNLLVEILEGMKEISGRRWLLWLFILEVVANFFIMPLAAMFPLMTLKHFMGSTYQMSLVEVAWGIGMLAGGALLGHNRLRNYKIVLINLMYMLMGITILICGLLSPSAFFYFVAVTAVSGIAMSVFSGTFTVVLQTNIGAGALGRVFSIYTSVTMMPSMIGLLATGFIADVIGIANAFVISGAAIFAVGVTAFLIRPLAVKAKEELCGAEDDSVLKAFVQKQ